MNRSTKNQNLLKAALCTLAVALMAAQGGATGDTFKQSAELGKRTSKTSGDVDRYVTQLDRTEQALSSISQAPEKDLRKRLESFSREINRLEDAQKHVTSDIDEMKSSGTDYFSSWDTSIAQMSDANLRQASTDRRAKVMKDHNDLTASLSDIGLQLQPFMSNLRDLRTFLEADLSSANFDRAKEMIQKSQSDEQTLKDKIVAVQSTLREFLEETPR